MAIELVSTVIVSLENVLIKVCVRAHVCVCVRVCVCACVCVCVYVWYISKVEAKIEGKK